MTNRLKVLVTGGAGYIGSHTVVSLINSGYDPIVLDNFSNSSKLIISQIEKIVNYKISLIEGDVSDESLLNMIFSKYDIFAVIHFASFKSISDSIKNPILYYENNVSSLIVLIKVMELFSISRFVFSSSCSVYGDCVDCFVTEKTNTGVPKSPYGWSKLISEQILKDCSKNGIIKPVLLRYFNPLGAHESGLIGQLSIDDSNSILNYMIDSYFSDSKIFTIFGNKYNTIDGTCIRDYIHVMDLAEAHVKSISLDLNYDFKIFNIGTGKGTSVLELINLFEKCVNSKLMYNFGNERIGDIVSIYANVELASKDLKWKSIRTISQAISDSLKWEQNKKLIF